MSSLLRFTAGVGAAGSLWVVEVESFDFVLLSLVPLVSVCGAEGGITGAGGAGAGVIAVHF